MKKPMYLLFFHLNSFSAVFAEESMTHTMTKLVLQLAMIVIVSRIFGHLFSKYLKLPKVLGELSAGMVIGPFALGALTFPGLGEALFSIPNGSLPVHPELYGFAVVASIILLFHSGLETDLPTFLRFSAVASFIGLGGVIFSFLLGDLTAVLFLPEVNSFMHPTALFLGTLATATSVGITARILSEKRKMSSPEGVTILAAAVLDDVIGIILLAVVVGIARVSSSGGTVAWGEIGWIALKAFGFWLGFTAVGIMIAPALTKGLKRFKNLDVITGLAFGLALLLAGLSEMAGLAMIIGAYVMGLSLSQTDMSHELQERLHGAYEFFVPIFFTVMGMMVNFEELSKVLVFGLIYTVISIFGKIIGCGLPALAGGFNLKGALRIGTGMLPRGEVTLIIAGIGLSSGAIGPELFGVAIMTLLISTVMAPPTLIAAFKGGSGYRKKYQAERGREDAKSIELSFSNDQLTEFVRRQVLDSFRNEEYFVQHMHSTHPLYHLRKDDVLITLTQKENTLILNTSPKHEQFVRLMATESVLELKDLLSGLEKMQSPDQMGADLLAGMFGNITQNKKED
jgi:Kef-type K+ transport system membrane component KefB